MDEVVRLQEEAGLTVVTDGEMRRESFQSQLAEAVEGFGEPSIEAYLWGDWRGGELARGVPFTGGFQLRRTEQAPHDIGPGGYGLQVLLPTIRR